MSKAPSREELAEFNEKMLFMDGFDEALLGICSRYGMNEVAAYDYEKVIEILMRDGMDRHDAVEFHEFNQAGAWMGDNTPVFIRLPDSTCILSSGHPTSDDTPPRTPDKQ